MPPRFSWESFGLDEDQQVEGHIEGYPRVEHVPGTWSVVGLDTFEGERYPLAIEIGSEDVARILAKARLQKLAQDQPTSTSGAQAGIQDGVYVVSPDGTGRRYFG